MKIFIVGTGTIGKPLIRLFLRMRKALDFEEIIYHKNTPELKCRGMLKYFYEEGAKLAVYSEKVEGFREILNHEPSCGFAPDYTFEEALERADLIIDCTDKGLARKFKEKHFRHLKNKLGFMAQGSENGFGKPYAYGINDFPLEPGEEKYIQIVSCNTHQILCVLNTLAFDPDHACACHFDNLEWARFYLARRDSDISQENGKIGVEVGEPVDFRYGSHQAVDAIRVLQTIDKERAGRLDIHAVADTFNNPFMHVVNFHIKLREKINVKEAERRFRANPLTAVTYEMTNNQVFGIGRDLGHFGRFLNHTIVCLPSLQIINGVNGSGHEIIGRCFTPQDGNPLLSSMAAALWFRDPSTYQQKIKENFFKLPFIFDEV